MLLRAGLCCSQHEVTGRVFVVGDVLGRMMHLAPAPQARVNASGTRRGPSATLHAARRHSDTPYYGLVRVSYDVLVASNGTRYARGLLSSGREGAGGWEGPQDRRGEREGQREKITTKP